MEKTSRKAERMFSPEKSSSLVQSDRLELRPPPRGQSAAADRGRIERRHRRPTEDEGLLVAPAARAELVGGELGVQGVEDLHLPPPRLGLRDDLLARLVALPVVEGALDPDHASLEVDVRPLERSQLAAA